MRDVRRAFQKTRHQKVRRRDIPSSSIDASAGSRPIASTSDSGRLTWGSAGLVGLFALLALCLHVFGLGQRPLWSDEAATYWTVHAHVRDILVGARTDGTPPIYFLAVSVATWVWGWSEVGLRLTSIVAATLMVPAVFVLARRISTVRVALLAAGLTALSPLVHYYAVEARNYALVQLETVAIVYMAWRAIESPDRKRWWGLLTLAYATQLATHNYGLFLLPVLPVVCLVIGGRGRIVRGAKAATASLAACIAYVPWFGIARKHAADGVGDWIAPFWRDTPPLAAVLRSFEVFGFGGLYPRYLSYLGRATPMRFLSVAVTAGMLGIAAACRWPSESDRDSHVRAKVLCLGFLLLPLIGAWLVSFLREPLYLVGRYDTIVLPVFLIVFAIGLAWLTRVRPVAGWGAVILTAGLGIMSHSTSLAGVKVDNKDQMAAREIAEQARASDPVVSTGLRRPAVDYYLDREGHHMAITSFPPEINDHPGWFSAEKILDDRVQLQKEADALAQTVAREGNGGHVWLLMSDPNEVDSFLSVALSHRFVVDEECTHRELELYCLSSTSAGPDEFR